MYEEVVIERMSYGTTGVGHRQSGKTVFVDNTAPGDVALIEIVEDKPRFSRGRVVELLDPSRLRAENNPACSACGGCSWSHMDYSTQIEAKRDCVVDALCRIGHFDRTWAEEKIAPCIPSKRQWGYRNKLELAVASDEAQRFTLGFHGAASEAVEPIGECPLAHKNIQKAPKALQGALRYAQGASDLGIFRIGVRGSLRTHDIEVALWTRPGSFPRAHVAKTIMSALKPTSIVRVLAEPGKARKIKGVETLEGKGCWEESLYDARFLTSAPSFFQVNTAQAEQLITCVMEGLGGVEGKAVADLYAGGGTFSIPIAQAGAEVVAVEAAGSSVRDLRRNADLNDVALEVVGGDTARELPELGQLDALVVDPPRAGLADGVVESISKAKPDKVAYVSCDPATWARDIARFKTQGYTLQKTTPVDLFPQTFHVETVSILKRR